MITTLEANAGPVLVAILPGNDLHQGLRTAAEVAALDTIAGKVIAQFVGEVPAELPPFR